MCAASGAWICTSITRSKFKNNQCENRNDPMTLKSVQCELGISIMFVTIIVFCVCVNDTVQLLIYLGQLVEKTLVINFDASCQFLFTTSVFQISIL